MTTQLHPTRTPLVPPHVREALARAWPDAPPNAIAVLMAQIGLETGWNSCVCWNLGNVKAAANGPVPWCSFATVEFVNGKRVELAAGAPGTSFRAFATLDEGIAFYFEFLQKKFARSWPAVLAGDPLEFARLLREQDYYTAPLADYQAGLERIFNDWADPPLATRQELAEALARLVYDTTDYRDAVMCFQREHELVVDGDAGRLTRRALRRELGDLTPVIPTIPIEEEV